MPEDRRRATLVAFTAVFTIRAQDDLIDLLERYLTELVVRTQRRSAKKRLRTLRDRDAAARATVFARASKDALAIAIHQVDTLTHPPDQTVACLELWRHYPPIRQVLPRLLAAIAWQGTVAAWEFLREHESQATRSWPTAPTTGITAAWRMVVVDDKGRIGKKAYTFWVLSRVLEGVRSHDLYVTSSERYGDPRARLLQGAAWDVVRSQVIRTLNWAADAESALRPVREALDAPQMDIAGFGDMAAPLRATAGGFARDEPDKGHERRRTRKLAQIAGFRHERGGANPVDTPQRLEGQQKGVERMGRHGPLDGGIDSLKLRVEVL